MGEAEIPPPNFNNQKSKNMLLQKEGQFNDLSEKLRAKLEEKINSLGNTVRFKFNISNRNPDPSFHDGQILWPNCYTLDPAVFNINDRDEVKGRQSSKRIGLVDGVDEKGTPNKFRKIKIYGRDKGILRLNVRDNPDHFDYAMYLLIHPKTKGTLFPDNTKSQIIELIDEQAAATTEREQRKARVKAMDIAEHMTDKEIIDFCDAMLFDSTQEMTVLRNIVEAEAETNPMAFNDLVSSKELEYRSAVKQAINKGLIMYDPAENKFTWAENKQTIAMLSSVNGKNEVENLAEWLSSGGSRENEVYNKIKSLIGIKEKVKA